MSTLNDPAVIERLLLARATWAVVGLSSNTDRAAHGVASYLQSIGHTIIPVHPKAEAVHGEPGYPSLADIPQDRDVAVVDIFVNSSLAGQVVDDAIARGARAVWLQLGVIDDDATQRALDAGLDVVMDRCPAIEGPQLMRALRG